MPEPAQRTRWIVSQIGAREHYAVPRAFHAEGQLERLYTEAWIGHGRELLRKLPGPARNLYTRYHADLPPGRVTSFTAASLLSDAKAQYLDKLPRLSHENFLRVGRWLGRRVARDLSRRKLDPGVHRSFLFNTGALETMQHLRERGIFNALVQLDPGQADHEMIALEMAKWPGWASESTEAAPPAYWDRIAQEWALADLIVVNSDWSKQSLLKRGIPASRVAIIPLAYEPELQTSVPARQFNPSKPLTVYWLGQIVLRKGIPYLFEAARRLASTSIRFIVAGNRIGISESALATKPDNMTLMGHVTRAEALRLYQESDVFVLPTLSDGFAITQLEAMAQGLPVIATRNCGDVVTDGVDGLLIPAGDADSLTEAIARLDRDRELLASMSRAAVIKSRQFTLHAYATCVEQATRRVLDGRQASAI